jgi:diguanylate cyclase (GGDEF)-like protein
MIDTKPTILIVDDTETNIDILLDLLSDYDVTVATDGYGALEIAKDDKPALILLDIMMPDMDGYEVCKKLQSDSDTKDIPVIFITAKTDEDSIEKAYATGGIDYITKPFKPRELIARVKTQLKLRELINHLDFIASFDQMTGIYNRRKFFELSTQRFSKSKEDLYGVMIDIDKFKLINDTYGHPVGDEVIKKVAITINDYILDSTIFGRMGGEEFALICHATSKEEVVKKIEEIRELIEKLEIITDDGSVVTCTISEGVSKASESVNSIDLLLKEADKALYEAKGKGRNRVIFR